MKILLINGSPKKEGNTYIALHEVQKTLEAEGIETELIHVGHKAIRGCRLCCNQGRGGKHNCGRKSSQSYQTYCLTNLRKITKLWLL